MTMSVHKPEIVLWPPASMHNDTNTKIDNVNKDQVRQSVLSSKVVQHETCIQHPQLFETSRNGCCQNSCILKS